jgi:hypothetical protein
VNALRPPLDGRPVQRTPATAYRARLAVITSALLVACAPFAPEPMAGAEFLKRASVQERDGLRISVAALSAEESRRYFGEDLDGKEVQPVWLQIENQTDTPVHYLPAWTDPAYFSPSEVSWMFHRSFSAGHNQSIDEHFLKNTLSGAIAPKGTASGFVLTHRTEGTKYVNVALFSSGNFQQFRFVVPVPGGKWDFQQVNLKALYPPEKVTNLDLPGLKATLEALPCCVSNKEGSRWGDPLNLVIVGNPPFIVFPFVERGWNLTEPFDFAASRKAAMAFIFGEAYESSPVSPLYLYGRPQDLALQKIRNKISQRNHLRGWLAPFTFQGQTVWVGQISRDIGVRLTTKSWYGTTHKIDPEADADRDYLLQDLAATGFVRAFGYVGGVGAAPITAPRPNLTGDPYYTDGKRLVVFLGTEPVALDKIETVKW